MIAKCRKCGLEGELSKSSSGKICKVCQSAYMREYNRKNREKVCAAKRKAHHENRKNPDWVKSEQKRGREYWQQLRHEAIMAYGGYECACCGETEEMFLSLDHVHNDGASHRREIGAGIGNGKGGSSRTLKWLKDNSYPDGFQVLCMNCNHGKARNNGICPHQAKLYKNNCVKTGEVQTGQSRAKPEREGVTTIQ